MANVIRLGDSTSHVGKVVGVSATWFAVDGIPVARVNAVCVCPSPGHSACTIRSKHYKDRWSTVRISHERI